MLPQLWLSPHSNRYAGWNRHGRSLPPFPTRGRLDNGDRTPATPRSLRNAALRDPLGTVFGLPLVSVYRSRAGRDEARSGQTCPRCSAEPPETGPAPASGTQGSTHTGAMAPSVMCRGVLVRAPGYPLAVTPPASSEAPRIPVGRSGVGHGELATTLVGRRVLSDNPLELSLRRRLGRDLGRFNPRPGPEAAPDRPCQSAIPELPHIPTSGSSYIHDFDRTPSTLQAPTAANSIANGKH